MKDTIFLAMMLKPFIALVVMIAVRMLADALRARMPNGPLKRILFTRLRG